MRGWILFVIWTLFGVVLLCWGVTLGVQRYLWAGDAVVLPGTVSSIRWSDSDGTVTGRPVVRVTMPDGEERVLTARVSSSLSSWSVGQRVDVLWEPASETLRLDSFGELYFPALFVIAVALFVLIGPVFCMAVWVWIWGWPTRANLAQMRAARVASASRDA